MFKIIKAILLTLNIVVLLLMIGSTMAGVIPPSKIIIFSLLSYGYLYLVLVNVVFVVIWLLMSSKWFLLSLVGIILRVSFIPLYFQVGGTDSLECGEDGEASMLKVMTFNAHYFRGEDLGWGAKDTNMLAFIQLVDEEQPDILVMQEYSGRGDTVYLSKRLVQMGYTYLVSGRENGRIRNNVIISKLPIIDTLSIDGFSKLYADIKWGDDTVRVFCLHLDSYHLDESDQQQIQDISHGNVDSTTGRGTLMKIRETTLAHEEEWTELSGYFESRDRMTIVAGDFNDPPASYFYQQCRKLFADSYCEAGQGFSTTYHGIFTRNAIFPAFRIDMVLYTHDFEAVAYRRVKTKLSDHNPVIVTMKKTD